MGILVNMTGDEFKPETPPVEEEKPESPNLVPFFGIGLVDGNKIGISMAENCPIPALELAKILMSVAQQIVIAEQKTSKIITASPEVLNQLKNQFPEPVA